MVSTYSQATRRDQNQCSLGSFGLVIKLRDCDIGLERDSSPFEREKMKREREPDLAPQTINAENRYAYKCANFIKLSLRDVLRILNSIQKKIIDHKLFLRLIDHKSYSGE